MIRDQAQIELDECIGLWALKKSAYFCDSGLTVSSDEAVLSSPVFKRWHEPGMMSVQSGI